MAYKVVDTLRLPKKGEYKGIIVKAERKVSRISGRQYDMLEIKSSELERNVFVAWPPGVFSKGDRIVFAIIYRDFKGETVSEVINLKHG